MTKPIYQPKGRAAEYAEYAINIYTGCNHGCYYCYAAKMAKRWGRNFTDVKPRKGIVEAVKKQLSKEDFLGRTIQLCFTCDPYPRYIDTTPTREIIKLIKAAGAHVQILTKGWHDAIRDFDLLDENDWFGVSLTGKAYEYTGLNALCAAKEKGIQAWISFEPVLDAAFVLSLIEGLEFVDLLKFGKLNYHPSDINWKEFGLECERLCQLHERNYYIKADLRREMEG